MVFDPAYVAHEQLPGHPESPERLHVTRAALEELGWWTPTPPEAPATVEQIALVHELSYVEALGRAAPGAIDADTYLQVGTYGHALQAAGGALSAMEAAL